MTLSERAHLFGIGNGQQDALGAIGRPMLRAYQLTTYSDSTIAPVAIARSMLWPSEGLSFTATLAGVGALTATAARWTNVTAALNASGTLTAAFSLPPSFAAELYGSGSLTASMTVYTPQTFASVMTGNGSLTVTFSLAPNIAAALDGSSTLTNVPFSLAPSIAAVLDGNSTLTGAVSGIFGGAADLTGVAGLTVTFVRDMNYVTANPGSEEWTPVSIDGDIWTPVTVGGEDWVEIEPIG